MDVRTTVSVADLVHRGDLDELVRAVDAAANRGDVDEVLALRQGCLDAVEFSGRQLWGPAAYAAYRLALDGPADVAVRMVVDATADGGDRHMLGPLTEVVAQHHPWAELRDLLPPGPLRGTVAVERVLRGEDLRGDPSAEVDHLDVPAHWLDWEGPRPRLEYRARDVLAPAPAPAPAPVPEPEPGGAGGEVAAADPGAAIDDAELVRAVDALVAPWATSPDARIAVVVVDGPAAGAVGAVAPDAVLERVELSDAVAAMSWAASSGGAARRRRGGAAGRSATWWALRTLVAHEPGSPVDDLRADLGEWSWWRFGGVDEDGWWLRLAAEHVDGWSLAVDARDPPPPDLVLPVPDAEAVPTDDPDPDAFDVDAFFGTPGA